MDLKRFRFTYKLSQSDIANLFACGQGHISNIEKGTRNLTELQLRILIDKYGIDAVEPFLDDKESASSHTVNIDMRSNEVKENNGNLQQGDGNTMTASDSHLIAVLEKQAQVISQQSEQINKLIAQQEKLINALVDK